MPAIDDVPPRFDVHAFRRDRHVVGPIAAIVRRRRPAQIAKRAG